MSCIVRNKFYTTVSFSSSGEPRKRLHPGKCCHHIYFCCHVMLILLRFIFVGYCCNYRHFMSQVMGAVIVPLGALNHKGLRDTATVMARCVAYHHAHVLFSPSIDMIKNCERGSLVASGQYDQSNRQSLELIRDFYQRFMFYGRMSRAISTYLVVIPSAPFSLRSTRSYVYTWQVQQLA